MPTDNSPHVDKPPRRALFAAVTVAAALVTKFALQGWWPSPSPTPSPAELARQREIADTTVAALDAVDQETAARSLGGPRVYAAFKRIGDSIAKDPKFQELARHQSGARQKDLPVEFDPGQELIATLAAQGIARLPPEDFLEIVKLRLKLAEASDKICAGFWSGGLSTSDFAVGLDMLGDTELQRWMDLSERAMRLQLYATTPLPRFSGKAYIEGGREILAAQARSERTNLAKTMEAGIAAPPADGCKAFLVLGRGGLVLPAARRDAFLRAFLCNSMVDWDL